MRFYLTFIFACFLFFQNQAQDTTIVQTFTWDMSSRSEVFQFPSDANKQYRKVWMKYNMRCHDDAVGNGSVGCREWDYSCNTFITDPTRVDSTLTSGPDYVISGFSGTSFPYSNTPNYGYRQINQASNVFDPNGDQEWIVLPYNGAIKNFPNTGNYKIQSLLTAGDLASWGFEGTIKGIILESGLPNAQFDFFRIRMQNTTQAVLTENKPADPSAFQDVYTGKLAFDANKSAILPFTTSFMHNGQNVIIELSFTAQAGQTVPSLAGANTSDIASIQTKKPQNSALFLDSRGEMDLPKRAYAAISDQITIAFWSFGLPDAAPSNSTLLEAVDSENRRQINIHFPWGNGQVYWDCGNDGTNYDRLNKAADLSEYTGKWNHWAFTKNTNTGRLEIYVNGDLWSSSTGNTRDIMDIQRFTIGKNVNNTNPLKAAIDDLSIWNVALSATEIQALMLKNPDASHPLYTNLQAYYPFDETSGSLANDLSKNDADTTILLPAFLPWRGYELNSDFETVDFIPQMVFISGDAPSTSSVTAVWDSFALQPVLVTAYELQGTDRVETGSVLAYNGSTSPIYDENLHQISSQTLTPDGTYTISQLDYYLKRDAKYEILSLVTPYGNGLDLEAEGKTFTFDVTDYLPILQGERMLSLEYGGQNQEEMDIKFIFIEGTPEREVLDVQNIWPQARGTIDQILTDARFEPRQVRLNQGATYYKIRSAVTGHGQNGEFVSRNHYVNINGGTKEFNYDVWKACGKNPIYPQGGTWVFDRAGWCPGMATDVQEFPLDGLANPGELIEIDYGVNGSTMTEANYLVNNQLVSYGAFANQLDASLEAIVRPNNESVEFERLNPSCNTPTVRVKNTGANALTSIEIEYSVGVGFEQNYTWTGTLASLETIDIVLPTPAPEYWLSGTRFYAKILKINGATDGNTANNAASVGFDVVKNLTYNQQLQLRFLANARPGDNSYRIKDSDGNVLLERTTFFASTAYTDNIDFPPGCYTLEIEDTGNDGLSFWFYPNNGNGSLRFQREISPNVGVPVYTFEPDFGAGAQFDFTIGSLVDNEDIATLRRLSAYPNPADDFFMLELEGFEGKKMHYELIDMTGKKLSSGQLTVNTEVFSYKIETQHFPSGFYQLRCTDGKRNYTQSIVVAR